jgi:hypothetical protein
MKINIIIKESEKSVKSYEPEPIKQYFLYFS